MQSVSVVCTWKLISAKAQNSDEDVILLYGEDPSGMLMYDVRGYMSAVLMRSDRSKFLSGDPLGGTSEEIKEAFEGFDACCGTYEVNAEDRTVSPIELKILGLFLQTFNIQDSWERQFDFQKTIMDEI